jgi:two-component system chemotaxis sensor kinase CheA
LPPRKWGPFWSDLAHVIRNTVDHGVETAAERAKAGKAPNAAVVLSILTEGPQVVVSIQDDGRGIDWAKIAERARLRGLPCGTRSELEEALFAEGISSSTAVSSTSGRGVGLSAVRAVVRDLGGYVEIQTEAGRGTTFRCSLPHTMLVDERPADSNPPGPAFAPRGWSRPHRSEKS